MCGKRFSRLDRDELSWARVHCPALSCVLEKGEGEIGCLCPRWDRPFSRSALAEVFDWDGMFCSLRRSFEIGFCSSCFHVRGGIYRDDLPKWDGDLVFGYEVSAVLEGVSQFSVFLMFRLCWDVPHLWLPQLALKCVVVRSSCRISVPWLSVTPRRRVCALWYSCCSRGIADPGSSVGLMVCEHVDLKRRWLNQTRENRRILTVASTPPEHRLDNIHRVSWWNRASHRDLRCRSV